MKITPINNFRKLFGITLAAGAIASAPLITSGSNQVLAQDTVTLTTQVPPKGTTDSLILKSAPSPVVFVTGERKNAAIVVDLSKNVLYKYDEDGQPEIAYRIASGKPRTPTDTGLRMVLGVEKYPYKSAVTGRKGSTGEFIHGNNNPSSIGKYASLGCMRMDNEVIKELASQVKRGDLVLITR